MKKFIVLLVACICVAVSACAGGKEDVTYTSYGNGVELITKNTHSFWRGDETVYGLRKGGVVLEKPITTNIIIQEELNIIVFHYNNGVNVYNLSNGAKVGEFFISKASHGWIHPSDVSVKPVRKNGKKCYVVHYSVWTDRLGKVDQDVVTLYCENGKLYKFEKKEVLTGVEM